MKNRLPTVIIAALLLIGLLLTCTISRQRATENLISQDTSEWSQATPERKQELVKSSIELYKRQGWWRAPADLDLERAAADLAICVDRTVRAASAKSTVTLTLSSLVFSCAMEKGWTRP